MKVILAMKLVEATMLAYEHGLAPRSRDVMLIVTDRQSDLARLGGVMLTRDDVIEAPSAARGRFYDDYKRQLEIAFYD